MVPVVCNVSLLIMSPLIAELSHLQSGLRIACCIITKNHAHRNFLHPTIMAVLIIPNLSSKWLAIICSIINKLVSQLAEYICSQGSCSYI
jgi:hypothetical protein